MIVLVMTKSNNNADWKPLGKLLNETADGM